MLNECFGRIIPLMGTSAAKCTRFVGDAPMVIFNKSGDQPDHPAHPGATAMLEEAMADMALDHSG